VEERVMVPPRQLPADFSKVSDSSQVSEERRPAKDLSPGVFATVMYIISFFLPAWQEARGYEAFVLSLMFLFCVPVWAANLVFWIGLAQWSQGRYWSASMAGLVALSLGLLGVWMFKDGLKIGYWLWVGSMGVLALGGLCKEQDSQPRNRPSQAITRDAGEASRIVARFRR
jgi:hypothetical protein